MKKVIGLLCACCLVLTVAGCGKSGETESVAEGADQSAIEAYQAEQAKDQQEMDATMKIDINAAAPAAGE